MFENIIQVKNDDFKGASGDSLHIDMGALRKDFPYCGLWYARDKSTDSVITVEFYYSSGSRRPAEPNEAIRENSFQQSKRIIIPSGHDHVWIAARVSDAGYGLLKLMDFQKGKVYLNSKVVKSRAGGADVTDGGIIRGGTACFAKLGIEDMLGTIDYGDTTLYLVLIKDPPPGDWKAESCLGVDGIPVIVQPCRFAADGKYSSWNGQNPLDGMRA